jgi:hypothetical protein
LIQRILQRHVIDADRDGAVIDIGHSGAEVECHLHSGIIFRGAGAWFSGSAANRVRGVPEPHIEVKNPTAKIYIHRDIESPFIVPLPLPRKKRAKSVQKGNRLASYVQIGEMSYFMPRNNRGTVRKT